MKLLIIMTTLIMLAVSDAFAGDAETKDIKPYSIDSRQFDGFEKCNINGKLAKTIKELMTNWQPVKKEATAWTFEINAEVSGLSAHEMQIGVCDISGDRSCGWGNFIAIVFFKPVEEVRKDLKSKFGTDFTKEKREKEYNVTLHPVLAKGKKPGESILFCDPGTL